MSFTTILLILLVISDLFTVMFLYRIQWLGMAENNAICCLQENLYHAYGLT